MSEWGGDLDALIAIAQAALPELAAAGRSERGVRLVKDLAPAQLPHLFVYEPRDVVTELPHQREALETTYTLLYVRRDATQEQVALDADALRDAIRANPTLSGRVLSSRVSERTLREHPAVADRGVGLLVTVRREG